MIVDSDPDSENQNKLNIDNNEEKLNNELSYLIYLYYF